MVEAICDTEDHVPRRQVDPKMWVEVLHLHCFVITRRYVPAKGFLDSLIYSVCGMITMTANLVS